MNWSEHSKCRAAFTSDTFTAETVRADCDEDRAAMCAEGERLQRTVKGFELLVEGHKQNEARLREALEQIVYADDQGYRAMISSTARAALSGETIQPMEYKIPVLPIDHEAEARIDRLVEQNRKPPADEDEFYARVMGHALKSKP